MNTSVSRPVTLRVVALLKRHTDDERGPESGSTPIRTGLADRRADSEPDPLGPYRPVRPPGDGRRGGDLDHEVA
jgi:hypothetical protein